MTNLKLITTETFGDLSCNFYRNMNDDILLTREQIGIALEYSDPDVALSKIHKKHKDRLDELSVVTKLESTDGKEYNTTLYSERGIMEICRWSRQPKANIFMDWVWDIIEKYRHNELQPNLQPLIDSLSILTQTITTMQQDINTRITDKRITGQRTMLLLPTTHNADLTEIGFLQIAFAAITTPNNIALNKTDPKNVPKKIFAYIPPSA